MRARALPSPCVSLSAAALLSLPKPYPSFPKRCPNSALLRSLSIAAAVAKPLDESDVGISCFVSSIPGFRGILKQRYFDFVVNEVDSDGNIVRLSSFELPLEELEEVRREDGSPRGNDYASEIESFRLLCGDVDADALKLLLERISLSESHIAPIMLSPDPDKSHRAEVHSFFKKNFKFLVTDTVDDLEGSSRCIRVRLRIRGLKWKDRKDHKPFDARGSENWPENLGKFLRFNLYKENMGTLEALELIGKMLGIRQRSFGFAGTKDKCSMSTQRVTVFKQRAKRFAEVNKRLFGAKVGNFCYTNEELILGQLSGNHFIITLRDVSSDCENTIKAAADGLGRNGFINYYGLQRFGNGSMPTHLVGATLIRGNWKDAAGLILDPREGEHATIREAREYYKEFGDIDLILKKLPSHRVAERAILRSLKKCPGNYLQALKAIPRTLRMMYVHSYQSYLWNHAASMRVQKYGISQVVLGDLVLCNHISHAGVALSNKSEYENGDSSGENHFSDLSNELISDENVEFVKHEGFSPRNLQRFGNSNHLTRKIVDSEDLLNGLYTFEDVVLPLPGSRMLYPANDIADVYDDLAKKDGVSLTESVHGAKEFSIACMKGGYRRVLQRPTELVWELVEYLDDHIPLVESDLGRMQKGCASLLADGDGRSQTKDFDQDTSIEEKLSDDGNEDPSSTVEPVDNSLLSTKLALKLAFTLPSSSYATMAVRELLKS